MEAKKNDFGWLLSAIAILLTVLIGLEGILLHFISRSGQSDVRLASILFLVFLWMVPTLIVSIRLNGYEKKEVREEALQWIGMVSAADAVFTLFFNDLFPKRWLWWVYPLIILLQTFWMYRFYQKRQNRVNDEEERKNALRERLRNMMHSEQKTCIVISNARQKDIEFEMNDRMCLYSLPDGQFLVLFKGIVEWETFQQALAAFQSVAEAKDDVTGYYRYPGALPFREAEPVLLQQTN